MQRLLSLTWLIRRGPIHPRISTVCTTGFPNRFLHHAIFIRTEHKVDNTSSNYDTMCKQFYGQMRQLHYKNIQNTIVNKRVDQGKPTAKQQTVKELLDVYVNSRDKGQNLNPFMVLDSIAKSTEKSAKQSLAVLNEPALQTSYSTLLRDINKSIENSKDVPHAIVSVLWALGTISKRQMLFINKCGIDIYPNEKSKMRESLLPEDGRILFDKIQNIILKQDLSCYQNKDLVTVLWCFVETKQGSAELFNELKKNILHQKATDYTSDEIGQIVRSYAKLKSIIDSRELFKTMIDEILHRNFVTFRCSEIPVILVSFVDVEQGNLDFYKNIKKDILSRDIRAFSSPELCQILWSFSKVKEKYSLYLSDLLNQFENEFLRRGVKRLDDRGLAVLLWSLVEMNYFSKKLFTLLRNVIGKRNVRKLNADDISTFLRLFAKVKTQINSHHIFTMIDKELVHRGFSRFNDSQLATTIWAFAETGNGCHALLILLKKEMFTRSVKDLNPVELSQITWGLAKVREKLYMRDLFEHLSNEIVENYDVSKLALRQLALLAWSFAVTDVIPMKLFACLQAEISKRGVTDCSNSALCQILYSFAVARDVVYLGTVMKSIERKIMVNQAGSFDNRQLALLVWSLAELLHAVQSTKVFEVLEKEVSSRPLQEYMPADICRILWGFSKVKSFVNTVVVFNSLRKELIRRGLGEYSIAQVTMATVALTKANEWYEDTFSLFKDEITSRNSRHFDGIHLCSLAHSFSSMSFDTEDLFCWLEEEVIARDTSAFVPGELLTILQLLVERNGKRLHFFEKIKKQLMNSGLKGYNKTDIDKLCLLLQTAGVETDDLILNVTTTNN